ncbi:hypothetical protein F5I97DRAFT_1306573 [Phlebopus sp. FC_14]|nr:hypothetical protein F5I97DRAFT_1306573 [Phlebopus sp. FC_14]
MSPLYASKRFSEIHNSCTFGFYLSVQSSGRFLHARLVVSAILAVSRILLSFSFSFSFSFFSFQKNFFCSFEFLSFTSYTHLLFRRLFSFLPFPRFLLSSCRWSPGKHLDGSSQPFYMKWLVYTTHELCRNTDYYIILFLHVLYAERVTTYANKLWRESGWEWVSTLLILRSER